MADLPVRGQPQYPQRNIEVKPTSEIYNLWEDMQIQECRSRINSGMQDLKDIDTRIERKRQEIEDLEKYQKIGKQAEIKMLQLKLDALLRNKGAININQEQEGGT